MSLCSRSSSLHDMVAGLADDGSAGSRKRRAEATKSMASDHGSAYSYDLADLEGTDFSRLPIYVSHSTSHAKI